MNTFPKEWPMDKTFVVGKRYSDPQLEELAKKHAFTTYESDTTMCKELMDGRTEFSTDMTPKPTISNSSSKLVQLVTKTGLNYTQQVGTSQQPIPSDFPINGTYRPWLNAKKN